MNALAVNDAVFWTGGIELTLPLASSAWLMAKIGHVSSAKREDEVEVEVRKVLLGGIFKGVCASAGLRCCGAAMRAGEEVCCGRQTDTALEDAFKSATP